MNTNYRTKPFIIYIVIVFGTTYVIGGVLNFINDKSILSNLIMLFPSISAIIVWSYFYKKNEGFVEFFSLRIGKLIHWVIYPLMMVSIMTLIYLISYIINSNLFYNSFGMNYKLLTPLLINVTIGVLISFLAYLGEELGWRSFMYPQLIAKLGTNKGLFIGGIIWGLWHLPLILQGHNYPNNPVLGNFFMIAMCMPLGIILYYTYIKTKTIFIPAILHGIFNQFATTVYIFAIKKDDFNSLIYGPTGIVGIIILSILALMLLVKMNKAYKSTTHKN
ncbi:type II CAAX endopeptidase family protein [Staphylococcus pettenkoferi]|uniref:type II CAAX endopeptidase family protein n=2 Tax=Staphylococcus TaxID=1279 RepID=UPI00138E1C72|nr:type II CAAX endopeptidase family protein [Staphylococcus massiliensis]MCG3413655.1 CPBP family intramembrane metalloprotease [Staphylococcus massiliensis]